VPTNGVDADLLTCCDETLVAVIATSTARAVAESVRMDDSFSKIGYELHFASGLGIRITPS
jgi:hypothetical protein